jgi:hypothetical protein
MSAGPVRFPFGVHRQKPPPDCDTFFDEARAVSPGTTAGRESWRARPLNCRASRPRRPGRRGEGVTVARLKEAPVIGDRRVA